MWMKAGISNESLSDENRAKLFSSIVGAFCSDHYYRSLLFVGDGNTRKRHHMVFQSLVKDDIVA